MVEITHRPLTRAEALCLHRELRSTPNILGYTVRELERQTDVQVAEADGEFAGMCFSVDLAGGWTDIAALYVLPACRGGGVGAALFGAAWERAEARRRHIYVLSRNPQVVGWMRARGMAVDGRLWRAPLAVHWHMQRHMASWHRAVESVRKAREISRCPPLRHGMKRYTEPEAHGNGVTPT